MRFRSLALDDIRIDDLESFRHVELHGELVQALRRSGYRFRVPEGSAEAPWARVLFLNLTFWAPDGQGDVLPGAHLPADVVAHVAWHHLAQKALEREGATATTVEGSLLGESIASAFDLYLVGRLLGHAPDSQFLETQVPAMADAAAEAGLSDAAFEALLEGVSADPERAFEDLRELLFDAGAALAACAGIDEAAAALARFDGHRFAPLLHHYELSNWILHARAHALRTEDGRLAPDPAARAIDAALRAAPVALDWLERTWVGAEAGASVGQAMPERRKRTPGRR